MRFRSVAAFSISITLLIASQSHAACPQPQFKNPIVNSGVGFAPGPHSIESGDFNNDGLADVLVTDSLGTSVFLANGTGHLLNAFSSGTSAGPHLGAMLDADHDGNLDYIMAFSLDFSDHDGTTLLPSMGDGTGNFDSPIGISYQNVGSMEEPRAMVVGDFNGDGNEDLVIAATGASALTWCLGHGQGQFDHSTAGLQYAPNLGTPVALGVGDLDKDGKDDLLVHTVTDTGTSTQQDLVVFFGGSSTGYAGLVRQFSIGNGSPFNFLYSNTIAVEDFNGDGKLDIAVQDPAAGAVTVVLGTAARLSPIGAVSHVPAAGVALAAGDLNGDGSMDLATADPATQQTRVLLGDGSGGFGAATSFPTSGTSTAIAIDRFNNGDGFLDIAVANQSERSASILLNACGGASTDIRVTGIEVTQVVQDLSNSVLLVAGKRTFVRVHVAANYDGIPVTANLQPLDANGAPIGPALLPGNAGALVTVRSSPDRAKLDDAFYFELPKNLTKAGSLRVRATVNPLHTVTEADYTNNTLTSSTVTFQPASIMKVRVVDYSFTRPDGFLAENTPEDIASLAAAIRSELPIDSLQFSVAHVYDPHPPAVLVDGLDDAKVDGDALVAWLVNYRATVEPENAGMLYYGLNREIHGIAQGIPSLNAVGTWFAATHEIGHMMGRFHTNCNGREDGPDVSYPFAGGKIGGPAGDVTRYYGLSSLTDRPAIMPSTTGDMMGYCDPRWPSSHNYTAIWNYRLAHPQLAPRLRRGPAAAASIAGDFLAVNGQLDPSTEDLSLAGVTRVATASAVSSATSGPYHLRLLNDSGATLVDQPFETHPTTEGTSGGLFSEVVHFEPGTRQVQIVSDNSSNLLASVPVSENPPTVSITTTVAGADLSALDNFPLEWIGSDLDGDALHYDIFYSADGGATWQMVMTGLTAESTQIPSSLLSGTGGAATGYLRVVASDGVLTGQDQGGPMTVADKAPSALILHPWTTRTFAFGQTITLEGWAQDLEDGTLDDAHLAWSSSLTGSLGTGRLLHVLDLEPGKHTITLTATDRDGVASSAVVSITVGPRVARNSAPAFTSVSPDLTVKEGATVSLSASASDPDDGQGIAVTAKGYPSDLTYTEGSAIMPTPARATVAGVVGPSDGDQNPTTYAIEWTASDGTLAATASTELSVMDVVPIRFTFTPGTLNLKSMGRWVTGYLEPPAPYTAADIDTPTVALNDAIAVDPTGPVDIGDEDGNGIEDLAVKFERAAVELALDPGDNVEVTVTGSMAGRYFTGTDHIRVLRAKVTAPRAGANLNPGERTTITWTAPTGLKIQSVALLSCVDGGTTWNLEASGLANVGHYDWTVPNVATSHARVAVVLVESADDTGFLVDGVVGTSGDFSIGHVTAVEESEAPRFALRAARPNPTVEGLRVNFGLADGRPARVEVFDVSGRLVAAREVGGMGPGFHTVILDERRQLASGVYLIRLSQAGKKLVTRAVLVR